MSFQLVSRVWENPQLSIRIYNNLLDSISCTYFCVCLRRRNWCIDMMSVWSVYFVSLGSTSNISTSAYQFLQSTWEDSDTKMMSVLSVYFVHIHFAILQYRWLQHIDFTIPQYLKIYLLSYTSTCQFLQSACEVKRYKKKKKKKKKTHLI